MSSYSMPFVVDFSYTWIRDRKGEMYLDYEGNVDTKSKG